MGQTSVVAGAGPRARSKRGRPQRRRCTTAAFPCHAEAAQARVPVHCTCSRLCCDQVRTWASSRLPAVVELPFERARGQLASRHVLDATTAVEVEGLRQADEAKSLSDGTLRVHCDVRNVVI